MEKVAPFRSRKILFLLAVLSTGLLAWFLIKGCAGGKGEVTVLNHTGQTITEGRLGVGPDYFDLGGLKAGESRVFTFDCSEVAPGRYTVNLSLADHRQTVQSIGSFQRGMDYHDTLTAGKDSLTLDSTQNPNGNTSLFYKGSQSIQVKWF